MALPSGVVAEYRFDEGSGQTVVDYSGGGHDLRLGSGTGTDTNDPTWASAGLDFATNDYCVRDSAPLGANPTDLTMLVVFNLTSTPTRADIFQHGDNFTGYSYASIWTGTTGIPRFATYGGGNTQITSSVTLSLNEWHGVVGRISAGTMSLLVDNAWEPTTAASRVLSGHKRVAVGAEMSRSGAQLDNPENFLNGSVGYAVLWNRGLSDEEVAQAYSHAASVMAGRGVALPNVGTPRVLLLHTEQRVSNDRTLLAHTEQRVYNERTLLAHTEQRVTNDRTLLLHTEQRVYNSAKLRSLSMEVLSRSASIETYSWDVSTSVLSRTCNIDVLRRDTSIDTISRSATIEIL
jgi:hypothetical protein